MQAQLLQQASICRANLTHSTMSLRFAVGTLVHHLADTRPDFVLRMFDKCSAVNLQTCVSPNGLYSLLVI